MNINLVAMDGGWKSTATGLASYRSLRHHHNVDTMRHSTSFMDQHRSELHSSNWRMGKVLRDSGVKIFQIETTLNNDAFPDPFGFLQKREWEWSLKDRAAFLASSKSLDRLPLPRRRQIFQSIKAPHAMTSVFAGEVEAVHRLTTERVYAQQLVPVEGQTDILTMGLPYICPYNVNSVMNPILVMCMGLGYFFNLYRGRPARARRRRRDHEPPVHVGVPPGASPELHRLLRRGALRDHRPGGDRARLREALRRGRVVPASLPDELRLPRRPPVLHVVLGCARRCSTSAR